ncbi:MAG TPA: hypothetical protein PLT75_13865 [Spirochaetota bacterium]|nr:hypothetical protein [Spirochaetota bacterium]
MKCNRGILLFLVSGLFLFPLCSGKWTLKDRYEGIRNNTIRVYVRSGEFRDNEIQTDDEIKQTLLLRAKKRCTVLLSYYIRSAEWKSEYTTAAGALLPEITASPKLRYFHCGNEYCEAFVDYTVKAMMPPSRTGKKNRKGTLNEADI